MRIAVHEIDLIDNWVRPLHPLPARLELGAKPDAIELHRQHRIELLTHLELNFFSIYFFYQKNFLFIFFNKFFFLSKIIYLIYLFNQKYFFCQKSNRIELLTHLEPDISPKKTHGFGSGSRVWTQDPDPDPNTQIYIRPRPRPRPKYPNIYQTQTQTQTQRPKYFWVRTQMRPKFK